VRRSKFYYKDGSILDHYDKNKILHRKGAPAIEGFNGSKYWCINDKYHREDGPSIEWASGDKAWCLDGKWYSEKQWKAKLKELNNET